MLAVHQNLAQSLKNEADVALSPSSWVDGTPVTYTAWEKNEPNFANNDENCVTIYKSMGESHKFAILTLANPHVVFKKKKNLFIVLYGRQ